MVTQAGGDHTCMHPRAVLHVKQADNGFDVALQNLQSSPASDISLSALNSSPDSPKVCWL